MEVLRREDLRSMVMENLHENIVLIKTEIQKQRTNEDGNLLLYITVLSVYDVDGKTKEV